MVDEDIIPQDLPPKRSGSPSNGNSDRDLRNLENEAVLRDHLKAELSQNLKIKSLAVMVGCAVSLFMGLILLGPLHLMSQAGASSIHPAIVVAAIVGPIVSVTTVTVALFVGAFRNFGKNNLDEMAEGASKSTSLFARLFGLNG